MKAFRCVAFAVALFCAAAASAQPRQNSFSVVLLVGDTAGPASIDGLPSAPGIRKALNDVKDFLPYKTYRVIDIQWLRVGSTRMKGPDDQEYEVEIVDVNEVYHTPPKPGVMKMEFKLQEAGAAANSSEEFGRSVQATELEKQRASLAAQIPNASGPMIQEMQARLKRVESQLRMVRAHKLMDSTFEMAPGETVVVGTSKIGGGDKGLVVLLTAVASGGK